MLNEETFQSKWKEWVDSHGGKDGDLFVYWWDPYTSGDDGLRMELALDDRYGRHDGEEDLAAFIQSVIAPWRACVLEFGGEDGARWGDFITSKGIKAICYERTVNGVELMEAVKELDQAPCLTTA